MWEINITVSRKKYKMQTILILVKGPMIDRKYEMIIVGALMLFLLDLIQWYILNSSNSLCSFFQLL